MSDEGAASTDTIANVSVEAAVERVLERDAGHDDDAVRAALERVSKGGEVCAAGVDDALADVSKLVTTAETRTELATHALSDVQTAAEPVDDLELVRFRLDGFESRLKSVEAEASDVSARLQTLVETDPAEYDYVDVAKDVRAIESAAREVQQAADDLQLDLERFEDWLTSHDTRVQALTEDVDVVADSLDGLQAHLDALTDASDAAARREWANLTRRHGVLDLLVEDIRAEWETLQTWAERDDVDQAPAAIDVDARIDALTEQWEAIDEQLAAVATADWVDAVGDEIDAFQAELATFNPPIDWQRVQELLECHQETADS